jgi:5'-deoxynucleotidase YfbR-like HD superfamily hydrolase
VGWFSRNSRDTGYEVGRRGDGRSLEVLDKLTINEIRATFKARILRMKDILTQSDEEILHIAHQLRVGYGMKRVLRYKTKRDLSVHSESNAEHVFALVYLASYFLEAEPSARSFDKEKIYNLILFHDFGEIKHGDVHTYDKTETDKNREKEAAKEIFASLPPPLNKLGSEYWHEYERQHNLESKFVFALDKIEPLFELLDPINERTLKVLKTTYELHIEHKSKAVKDFPILKQFHEVISKDMRDRGVFWKGQ